MNRIQQLFKKKATEKILSIYFTAGYPNLNDTETILLELEKNAVDLIEIGIPFSDPLADGPLIQASGKKALENGMTLKLLFEQLKDIRQKTQIPLVLMGYLNPVLQYGIEQFCTKCQEIGIDGVILPDLPVDYYQKNYQVHFEKHKLNNILLISPDTTENRIREIDNASSGFVYLVSSNSITGANKSLENQQEYFKKIKEMKLNNPQIVGFGIHNNETYKQATEFTNGAIIGSAFIKNLSNSNNISENISKFIQTIRS